MQSVSPATRVSPEEALHALTTAVQELSLAETAEEVQRIVRTAARRLTGADGATFVLRDEDRCSYVDEDAIEPLWKGKKFPLEACISGWSMLNRRDVVIEDVYADERIPHDAYRPTFVQSLAMVPIRTLDPVGAIGMYWGTRHRATAEQVGLAKALADSTAVALEKVRTEEELARARHLSETDPLTGLANRRAFDEATHAALLDPAARACVAMVELDHFKRFNDRYGHPAGDRLLRSAAAAWREVLRDGDVLARYGGEEFALLLPDCALDQALVIAERLRRAVPESQTVSVGVASWDGEEIAAECLARADAALYAAKTGGRDRVAAA